jgi:hypothetical protein
MPAQPIDHVKAQAVVVPIEISVTDDQTAAHGFDTSAGQPA